MLKHFSRQKTYMHMQVTVYFREWSCVGSHGSGWQNIWEWSYTLGLFPLSCNYARPQNCKVRNQIIPLAVQQTNQEQHVLFDMIVLLDYVFPWTQEKGILGRAKKKLRKSNSDRFDRWIFLNGLHQATVVHVLMKLFMDSSDICVAAVTRTQWFEFIWCNVYV